MNAFRKTNLVMVTLLTASAVQAGAFRDFVWPYFESLELRLPREAPFETGAAPRTLDIAGDTRLTQVLALYEASLRKDLKVSGPIEWKSEKLPSSVGILKSRPLSPFFNDHLIWAFSGKKPLAFFRPVDTSTDCDTGCTPVVFHLRDLPKAHAPAAILEESEWPLRKVNHEPFTNADRRKVLGLAQKLPQGLALIEHPSELADADHVFPPQTWTVHRKFLVAGAAYTSYRVYEAALKTARARKELATEAAAQHTESLLNDWVVNYLEIADAKVGQAFFAKSLSELNGKSPPELRRLMAHLLPYLALWLTENQKNSTSADALLANTVLRDYFREDLCRLSRNFLKGTEGRKVLLARPEKPRTPFCSEVSDRTTRFLALSLEGKPAAELQKYYAASGLEVIPPPGILADPFRLKTYLEALEKFLDKKTMLKGYADLATRFPKSADTTLPTKLNEEERAAYVSGIAESEKKFREELSRKLEVKPRFDFPKVTLRVQDGSFRVFDPAQEGKQIVVFFATWCPHCQKTVKSWMSKEIAAQLNPAQAEEFWKKTQFIEVFGNGQPSVKEFCKHTGLPDDRCAKILVAESESTQTKVLTEKLSILGVPRITILDPQGGVALGHFDVNDADEFTILRNLLWLAQAL